MLNITRTLTLTLALGTFGCSGAVPAQTGYYQPKPMGVEATIPIRVRSVNLLASEVDEADGSSFPVALADAKLRTLEREISEALQIDLAGGGPFREPKDGEAPYLLDAQFTRINMPVDSGPTTAIQVLDGLLVFIPVLFGVPFGFINVRGDAVFHLYAPNGSTLIQETVTHVSDSYSVGLYYGQGTPIGSVAGTMLRVFKQEAVVRRADLLAKRPVLQTVALAGGPVAAPNSSQAWPTSRLLSGDSPFEIVPRAGAIDGKRSIALVIGIEKYRRELPEATGAASDAYLFARFAETTFGLSPNGIHVLVNQDATKSSIDAELDEWLPKNASAAGNIYVFFAGHGAPDPQSGARYLVPWDADPKFIATQGINIEKLTGRLAKLNSAHTFVFVDACFSGAGGRSVLAAGTRPLVVSQAPLRFDSNRLTFLSASGPNETTGVGPANHGLFSYHVFRGLNGEADKDHNGAVTLGELVEYTGIHVSDDARRANRDQHPTASGVTGATSNVVLARLPPR